MSPKPVSVTRVIAATPEAIFAIVADPARHHEIDGSGTVLKARSSKPRTLAVGDSFGMDMNWGVAYSTRNEVVELVPNRVIAWRTLAGGGLNKIFTGRTWRYELEPVEGGTRVTETWDPRTEALPTRYLLPRLATMTRSNMTKTLERLAQAVEN